MYVISRCKSKYFSISSTNRLYMLENHFPEFVNGTPIFERLVSWWYFFYSIYILVILLVFNILLITAIGAGSLHVLYLCVAASCPAISSQIAGRPDLTVTISMFWMLSPMNWFQIMLSCFLLWLAAKLLDLPWTHMNLPLQRSSSGVRFLHHLINVAASVKVLSVILFDLFYSRNSL